jgi:hypothetical protein
LTAFKKKNVPNRRSMKVTVHPSLPSCSGIWYWLVKSQSLRPLSFLPRRMQGPRDRAGWHNTEPGRAGMRSGVGEGCQLLWWGLVPGREENGFPNDSHTLCIDLTLKLPGKRPRAPSDSRARIKLQPWAPWMEGTWELLLPRSPLGHQEPSTAPGLGHRRVLRPRLTPWS